MGPGNSEQEKVIERLREHEVGKVKILEALNDLKSSKAWSSLKDLVFTDLTIKLEREIMVEARREAPDLLKISRLSGQLDWAERFADLQKFEDAVRLDITRTKQMLYGKSES